MSLFSFFRKKTPTLDFSILGTDMHSHLIPGVDDGAKDLKNSIELIKSFQKLGYKKIITTPHVYKEFYPNTSERLLQGLEILRQGLKKERIDMEVSCAAEYFMDEHFEKLVKTKDLLPVFENYVLVEMSFLAPPRDLFNYLFQLRLKGYKPIMAHPERYLYYKNDFSKYEKLKEVGCKFQLNILSISGNYGKEVQKNAIQLLKKGMIDFLGTDAHNLDHTQKLEKFLNSKMGQKILKQHEFMNQTFV